MNMIILQDYKKYGVKIWENEIVQINEWQTRLFLIDKSDGNLLNELISGREGLKKYYKNNFEIYTLKMIKKNLKNRVDELEYYEQKVDEQLSLIDYYKMLLEQIKL